MRPLTTSRTLLYACFFYLSGCLDSSESFTSPLEEQEYYRKTLKNGALKEQSYSDSESAIYLFVKLSSENLTVSKRLGGSLLQRSKALLDYAKTRCPSLTKIDMELTGLSRRLTLTDGGLYLELWSVSKEQIDEKIQSMCER